MKILFLLILSGLLFLFGTYPFFLSLNLLSLSFLCLYLFLDLSLNYIFSFVFFLVYLGGILILFVYISCMLPNDFTFYPSLFGLIVGGFFLHTFVSSLSPILSFETSNLVLESLQTRSLFLVFILMMGVLVLVLSVLSLLVRFCKFPMRKI